MGSRTNRARVARVVFPPEQVAAVKAVACELPVRYGLPLGRFSRTELYRLVIELAVTPDRGYCFSVRGLARELGCALDTHFADPAKVAPDHAGAKQGHVSSDFSPMESHKRGDASEINEVIGDAPATTLSLRANEGNIHISEVIW